jgi:tetratricopeptide (TPR) repeat protein/TolB-like protein
VVAIAPIDVTVADSAVRWLGDGLPQMIAARLSRAADVSVVLPSRVRAVQVRAELPSGALSTAQLRELGRRVGADAVVSGAVAGRGGVTALELALVDTRSGQVVRLDAVADSSVFTLVDRAAVRLLDALGARAGGPRLADLETSSVEAYRHYVRYVQLAYERPSEGEAELDAAVALDSGFTSAVLTRLLVAMNENDGRLVTALDATLRRRGTRIPARDRLEWESRMALHAGDLARSERLAELLVRGWPTDPRGYTMLADIQGLSGRWDARDSVLQRILALDSLGMEAGRGPCSACYAFGSLVDARIVRGDLPGAERAARRWVTLTPTVPGAWVALSLAHMYQDRHDAALAALTRARELAPDEPWVHMVHGWAFVMARRLDAADSAIAAWERSDSRAMRIQAADLRSVVLRERGRFRAADSTIAGAIAQYPELTYLQLVRANAIARTGDCAGAVRAYEWMHGPGPAHEPRPGGEARGFAWHHALLADALASVPAGARCAEAAMLPALADSVERIGRRSYYGRDWVLHHHVRALIAERAGDWARAEREFVLARWGRGDGWTRTTMGIARAQLAQGRTADAVATLREAYHARPDAMGRYQPRSEIDLVLSRAFERLGMTDSAHTYLEYARAAWKEADPEVKALLAR